MATVIVSSLVALTVAFGAFVWVVVSDVNANRPMLWEKR